MMFTRLGKILHFSLGLTIMLPKGGFTPHTHYIYMYEGHLESNAHSSI